MTASHIPYRVTDKEDVAVFIFNFRAVEGADGLCVSHELAVLVNEALEVGDTGTLRFCVFLHGLS